MVPVSSTNPGCPSAATARYHGTCSTEPSVTCDPSTAPASVTGNCELGSAIPAPAPATAPSQNELPTTPATNDDCTGTPVCYAGRYLRPTVSTPGTQRDLRAWSAAGSMIRSPTGLRPRSRSADELAFPLPERMQRLPEHRLRELPGLRRRLQLRHPGRRQRRARASACRTRCTSAPTSTLEQPAG